MELQEAPSWLEFVASESFPFSSFHHIKYLWLLLREVSDKIHTCSV